MAMDTARGQAADAAEGNLWRDMRRRAHGLRWREPVGSSPDSELCSGFGRSRASRFR